MQSILKKSFAFLILQTLLVSISSFAQVRVGKKLICTDSLRTMTGFEIRPIADDYFRFTKYELKELNGEYTKGKIILNRVLGYDVDRSTAQYSYFDKRGEIQLLIFESESEEGTHVAELSDYTENKYEGNRTDYHSCK